MYTSVCVSNEFIQNKTIIKMEYICFSGSIFFQLLLLDSHSTVQLISHLDGSSFLVRLPQSPHSTRANISDDQSISQLARV